MPCHAHTNGRMEDRHIYTASMHACMEGDVGTREIISWIIEVIIISRGRAGHAATAAAAGTYVVRGHVAMHISRASMARSLTKTSSRPIRPSSLMARQVVWPCVCVRCHVHSYVKAPTSTCTVVATTTTGRWSDEPIRARTTSLAPVLWIVVVAAASARPLPLPASDQWQHYSI